MLSPILRRHFAILFNSGRRFPNAFRLSLVGVLAAYAVLGTFVLSSTHAGSIEPSKSLRSPIASQNFVVTNVNDNGSGSLRQALLDANANSGSDAITFNIPGSGAHTINLTTALPDITDTVLIDGTTQPGYAGTPLIELDGSSTGGTNGLVLKAGGSTIRGLAIGHFSGLAGIWIYFCDNNTIQGNYIGVDSTGVLRRANHSGILLSGAANNLIGGTTAAARNVISSNSLDGIELGGTNNLVQGNFIGTDASGTAALSNGSSGVNISSSQFTGNVIGGTTAGAGNLISGNPTGISVGAPQTIIQGNLIGTDPTGTVAIGNGSGIRSSANNVLIGGTVTGARNIVSGNNGDGVSFGGNGSMLQGNFIGTDITGTAALGNGGSGVVAGNGALIGGTTSAARNIISANRGLGNISLGSNNAGAQAIVQGNYIGTDVTGNIPLKNPAAGVFAGITISGPNNTIGGLSPAAANVISGNDVAIQIGGLSSPGSANGNTVQGNLIGLNAAGTSPLPNTLAGIRISDSNNIIGGTSADAANRISFNGGPGVQVSSGSGNSIRGNSVFSNTGLGIDLGPDGVTPNDAVDADTGANNLQNFPVLTSTTSNGGSTTIQGSLNSKPNTTFQINFYSNTACDPAGNGEGAHHFDTSSVTTDASGNASINFSSSQPLAAGRVLTATATDSLGNTSEFSPCDSTNTAGSAAFESASNFVLEDVGSAVIRVIRSGGTKGTLSVNYSSANGTATAGSDYTAVSGTLVFADGETTKTLMLPIANDGVTEPDETLQLTLTSADLERLGAPPVTTVTIQGNNTPLYLFAPDVSVPEGDSGSTTVTITASLSAQTGRTVTVDFATQSQTAASGVDFVPVSGTLTFEPTATSKTISVQVNGDTLDEFTETFTIEFSNPVNLSGWYPPTIGILDDDPPSVLSIVDVAVNEGNSGTTTAVFNLTLSPASGKGVTVFFNTANGTATSGSDYVASSSSVTFFSGQTTKTVTIQVNGDTAVEPNETFLVNLFSASGATIGKAQGLGTILDDDGQAPLELILEDGTNQIAAVDSLLLTRGPFHVANIAQWWTLGSDLNTHLLVFVRNVQLNQGETAAAVEVILVSGSFTSTVPADDMRAVPNSDFSQLRFRLPDNLPPGLCTVSVRVHGQFSNSGVIQILQ